MVGAGGAGDPREHPGPPTRAATTTGPARPTSSRVRENQFYALSSIRDLLRAAEARTDATGAITTFSRASRRLEALLSAGGGWAEWLVYGLERRDFVWHGFRQVDLWVTDKGRLLVRAVERFGLGAPPDAEPGAAPDTGRW